MSYSFQICILCVAQWHWRESICYYCHIISSGAPGDFKFAFHQQQQNRIMIYNYCYVVFLFAHSTQVYIFWYIYTNIIYYRVSQIGLKYWQSHWKYFVLIAFFHQLHFYSNKFNIFLMNKNISVMLGVVINGWNKKRSDGHPQGSLVVKYNPSSVFKKNSSLKKKNL